MHVTQVESLTLHCSIFAGCNAQNGRGGSFFVDMQTRPVFFNLSDIELFSSGEAVKGTVMYLILNEEGWYETYLDVWRHLAKS